MASIHIGTAIGYHVWGSMRSDSRRFFQLHLPMCVRLPVSLVGSSDSHRLHTEDRLVVAISIWGFYIPNSTLPVLSASLDGEHVQASPPPRSSDNPNIWHRWEVITADNLSQANHTIELVVQDAGPHYWFCLHEIVLTPTSHISQYLVSSSGNATTDTTPTSTKESSKPKSSVGAIVGGVIGAIAFVLLVGAVGVYLWRRRRGRYTYARTQVYDDGERVYNAHFAPADTTTTDALGDVPQTGTASAVDSALSRCPLSASHDSAQSEKLQVRTVQFFDAHGQ